MLEWQKQDIILLPCGIESTWFIYCVFIVLGIPSICLQGMLADGKDACKYAQSTHMEKDGYVIRT